MRIFLLLLVAFVVQLSVTTPAQATGLPSTIELAGYVWSGYTSGSEGVGWISLNCSNTGTCGTSYRVSIAPTGAMSGYAWSPNIGWIRFGGLSGFPSGAGTSAVNAQTTGTFPNLTMRGWARACSVFVTNCAGALKPAADLGGWDGWISLGGTGYSITFDSTGVRNNSYAWGGSTVVGSINFSPAGYVTPPPPAIASFTATPLVLRVGGVSTLTYNVSNAVSCTATNNNGDTTWVNSLPLSTAAGNHSVAVTPPLGTTVYTLNCTNGITNTTRTVSVKANADILITSPVVNQGAVNNSGYYPSVTVQFILTGIPNGANNVPYRVVLNGVTRTGTVNGNGSPRTINATFTNVPFGSIPYTIEVDHLNSPNPYGVVEEDIGSTPADEDDNTYSATVTFDPPNPIITFTGPPLIRSGETATFQVSVTAPYAATCTVIGGGLSEPVTVAGALGAPVTNTVTIGPSNPLTSTSLFQASCDIGTNTETYRVEVVPTYQEI